MYNTMVKIGVGDGSYGPVGAGTGAVIHQVVILSPIATSRHLKCLPICPRCFQGHMMVATNMLAPMASALEVHNHPY